MVFRRTAVTSNIIRQDKTQQNKTRLNKTNTITITMGTNIVIIPILLSIGLSIWTMLDILKSKQIVGNMKIAWLFLIFGIPFLGSYLYFHLQRKQAGRQRKFKPIIKPL